MSKKAALLAYLKDGNQITLHDSIRILGLAALSQRCTELKREGHPIRCTLIKVAPGTRVGCYWYAKRRRK